MNFSNGQLSSALATKYTEIPSDAVLIYIHFSYIGGLSSVHIVTSLVCAWQTEVFQQMLVNE